MKRLLAIMTAGLLCLLSFNSCVISYDDWDSESIRAYFTAYYAGGLPTETVHKDYEFNDKHMTDREIESIFHDLSRLVTPGFFEGTLEIEHFDWMNKYLGTNTFEFWWEAHDLYSGEGAYVWEEADYD